MKLISNKLTVACLAFILSHFCTAQVPDFAWAKNAGGSLDDYGDGIAVDGAGNSYVTGTIRGTATFGNTAITATGYSDTFIAKYDPSGNVIWAKRAEGTHIEVVRDRKSVV